MSRICLLNLLIYTFGVQKKQANLQILGETINKLVNRMQIMVLVEKIGASYVQDQCYDLVIMYLAQEEKRKKKKSFA